MWSLKSCLERCNCGLRLYWLCSCCTWCQMVWSSMPRMESDRYHCPHTSLANLKQWSLMMREVETNHSLTKKGVYFPVTYDMSTSLYLKKSQSLSQKPWGTDSYIGKDPNSVAQLEVHINIGVAKNVYNCWMRNVCTWLNGHTGTQIKPYRDIKKTYQLV